MHHIALTPEDESDLRFYMVYDTCAQVRTRCLAILLRGNGLSKDLISKITGAALSSQTLWEHTWTHEGLEQLAASRHQGRQSSVKQPQRQSLSAQFEQQPPRTLMEARERVCQATGRSFSLTGVRNFLRDKLKIRRRKAKQVPPRCDDAKKKGGTGELARAEAHPPAC